jgi:hypothetical protein
MDAWTCQHIKFEILKQEEIQILTTLESPLYLPLTELLNKGMPKGETHILMKHMIFQDKRFFTFPFRVQQVQNSKGLKKDKASNMHAATDN